MCYFKIFLQNTKSNNDFIYIYFPHVDFNHEYNYNYCLSCIIPKNSSTIFSFVSINRINYLLSPVRSSASTGLLPRSTSPSSLMLPTTSSTKACLLLCCLRCGCYVVRGAARCLNGCAHRLGRCISWCLPAGLIFANKF